MNSTLRPPLPETDAGAPAARVRPLPPWGRPARAGVGAALVFLGVLWLSVCWRLSAEWSVDEQYGYGWFVPVFALALGLLRWETRPPPVPPSLSSVRTILLTFSALGLALLAPVRLFQDANPDWRLLGWLHTGAAAGLTLLILWAAGGRPWLRHGAFPVGFFFVAVPWIKSIEEWTVQGLMRGIAVAAAESMELLGVPTRVEGNLLRVSTGTVGVNEACSGVRSLQTSLMMGLLLGELHHLRPVRRVALVAAAAALALAANFVRALTLVWLAARHGMAAAERGHDAAGYVILGAVFVGTLGLAALLRPPPGAADQPGTADRDRARPSPEGNAFPVAWAAVAIGWLAVVEIGVEGWYRWHERGLVPQTRWTVRWPTDAPDFRAVSIDEHTRRVLHYDEGRGANWRVTDTAAAAPSPGADAHCLLYFFHWKPGRNSALLANAHRPDVCLPASGWQPSADLGVRFYPVAPGLTLPFRHFEFTRPGSGGGTTAAAHVFYCLWEDRARPTDRATAAGDLGRDPALASRGERWEAVRDGRRHLGQRVMELALLGPGLPASTAEAEAAFARLLNTGLVTPAAEPGGG